MFGMLCNVRDCLCRTNKNGDSGVARLGSTGTRQALATLGPPTKVDEAAFALAAPYWVVADDTGDHKQLASDSVD